MSLAVAFKQCNANAELVAERNDLLAKLAKATRKAPEGGGGASAAAAAASGAGAAANNAESSDAFAEAAAEGKVLESDNDEEEEEEEDEPEEEGDEQDRAQISVEDIVRNYHPTSAADFFNTIS